RVLRLRAGDRVVLFDGAGRECDAHIEQTGAHATRLQAAAGRAAPMARGPALILVQGLLKGDKMDLVVQKATELGVARIVPVTTARSVATSDARRPRWTKIAQEAARQSGRADVPEIAPLAELAAALAAAAPAGALRLLFWEDARDVRLRDLVPAPPPAA